MLSTANPPPDPSSDEISKLKSGYLINSDEKAINYLEVDLLQSGLDDISQTLPKFSIRGYVNKTRGKDIKTNWPFSRKSLKLCLNNGVKDVLPPFETIESVRNPFSANLSGPSDHILPVSSKNASQTKVDLDSDKLKSNSHEKDKQYYPSDVNPVPFRIKSPTTKPEIIPRAANKVRSNISTQNPAKKCKLIVKVGNNNISEELSDAAMASKVCPVCKTFTSSSNTTLNAHIDQCLSGESTSVKWTENPKVIKQHRIKPRKTRLMVDIYETALPCTLEDLDRRNGTNWASNFGFQAQENDNTNENNVNHSVSNGEDKKEESAVYIDSNGTKLRILSKLGDSKFNSNGEEDDCGPRKLVKRDKESKIVPSKKMKLLKRQPYEQRRSPRLDSCPKETKFSNEETQKDDVAQPLKARDRQTEQINNVSGPIKPWVSSKRTYHKGPNRITRNSRIKTHSPPLDDNPLSATASDHTSNESESNTSSSSDDEYMPEQQRKQPCLTNKACFYFSDDNDNKKNDCMMLSNRNFKRLRESESIVNVDRPFITSRGKKLSTLTKNNSLSIRRELFSKSKKCLGSRNFLSGFKKSAIRLWNNYPVKKQGKIDETRVEKESRVLKMRKKRLDFLNKTASSSESDRHGSKQNKINSFAGHVRPAGTFGSAKVVETSDELVHEEEEPLVAFGDDFGAEVNVSDVEGHYFVDVDPIPIPGPPGSFLPSPGRMDSEELQGNSSLTSCRLHSSEDEHELIIDRIDSSGSTISGTSFVSNSTAPLLSFQAFGPNENSKTDKARVKPVFPESPSPSTPNPVLRLMGKDLMVVNKEENPSTQFGPGGFVSTPNGFPNRPSCADDVINFSRDPFVFDDKKTHMAFDFTTLPQLPVPHHQSRGFVSPSLNYCHGYADGPVFAPGTSNCGGKRKEIIVIDDSPKKEPTLGYKQHVNPFFDYQTRYYPHAPIPSGNSVIWNRDPHEGPSLQRRDLLNAPLPLTGHHERSSFYFSNRFSLPSNFS